MVQMTAADQAIVKAIPGNTKCADCGMKSPQWASVSFGTIFCLECSGVHRSLGVHISFVRSIAMDSWTDKQLSLMKVGGNSKCADYLKAHGVNLNASIREKYSSPAAQLYKDVLKARAEGRPEPTKLPAAAPSSGGARMGAAVGKPGEDPNGMERLTGESEQQYVARQTRLREEARARMAAKFGGSGGGMGSSSSIGMAGGGGGRMTGIGSDSSYNPSRGGYGGVGGGSVDVDSIVTGFSSAMTSLGTMTRNVGSKLNDTYHDESTQRKLHDITGSLQSGGSSLWSSFSTAASSVAQSIAQPDGDDDGLTAFQREMHSHRPTQSKYGGFGSDSGHGGMRNGSAASSMGSNMSTSNTIAEAQGLPGEDRNGIERLTGESDEQYVMRQTCLRDEAKARMAAKFGGGGMSAASSTSYGLGSSSNHSTASSSGMMMGASAPSSGNAVVQTTTPPRSAPTSGSFGGTPARSLNATKVKVESTEDFFANFGT